MREILQNKLFENYSNIFQEKDNPKSSMHLGLDIQDGWYELVDMLCYKLIWLMAGHGTVVALQVKQKFAGLRFYYDVRWDDNAHKTVEEKEFIEKNIHQIVSHFEFLSGFVCEHCGTMGFDVDIKGSGYIQTLCPECWNSIRRSRDKKLMDKIMEKNPEKEPNFTPQYMSVLSLERDGTGSSTDIRALDQSNPFVIREHNTLLADKDIRYCRLVIEGYGKWKIYGKSRVKFLDTMLRIDTADEMSEITFVAGNFIEIPYCFLREATFSILNPNYLS